MIRFFRISAHRKIAHRIIYLLLYESPSKGFLPWPGGYSGWEIPVPIPNTAVKTTYADDTPAQAAGK